MEILKSLLLIIIGFSSGIVISGAVFAFIAIIGIIPKLSVKTNTTKYVRLYEEAIIWGGIFGASTLIWHYYLPFGKIFVIFFSLCIGIFYGCLAILLAEVFDVIPILTRRMRVSRGVVCFILAIAFGKLSGSLLFYFAQSFSNL